MEYIRSGGLIEVGGDMIDIEIGIPRYFRIARLSNPSRCTTTTIIYSWITKVASSGDNAEYFIISSSEIAMLRSIGWEKFRRNIEAILYGFGYCQPNKKQGAKFS